MPSRTKLPGTLSGAAGVYLVAGELSRRGVLASLTIRSAKGIDLLASMPARSGKVGIQVKTTQGRGRRWTLSEKDEGSAAEDLFYVFVRLKNPHERPDFFIVPSNVVAGRIRRGHRKWLRTPGKGGGEHRENPMRTFRDPDEEFLERWDLLGL